MSDVLSAKDSKRGAEIVIRKRDGELIRGELIAVKPESLLVLGETDISVGYQEVYSIKIVRKSKAGTGALLGFLVGAAAGGTIDLIRGSSKDVIVETKTVVADVISLGLLGVAIGATAGAFSGADETVKIKGENNQARKEEIQKRLRPLARMTEKMS